ncbi:MAG TPA: sugar phosphate nucleotidyltransferase [Streptosporangiaceae bacterium]|jgi:glucose-1-phosphate cytidylyltransferase
MESLQINRPGIDAVAGAGRMVSRSGEAAAADLTGGRPGARASEEWHESGASEPALDAPPAVVLCGGAGQRMGELAAAVPKPMLTVGATPLLMHVMRLLAAGGSDEFVLAVGHLGHVVKDFFLQFQAHAGDFTVRLGREPSVAVHGHFPEEGWQVTCADTGERAGTGTRLRNATRMVSRWPIIVAYGDVLADVDIADLVRYHRAHGRLATVTAAAPPARFGQLALTADHRVLRFDEKRFGETPEAQPGLVSIGFFVLEQAAVERYIPADRDVMFEEDPIREMAADGELMAYRHDGYWQPVDTPKELAAARGEWDSGDAPWKVGRT